MALCPNRPDGFGPISSFPPHTLTTCFLDTILVPLCTWIYIAALLAITLAHIFHHRSGTSPAIKPDEGVTKSSATKRKRWLYLTGQIVYAFLLLAVAALTALEIARLSKAGLGIGLLPFTFLTLLIAPLLHFSNGVHNKVMGWRWLNVSIFSLLAVAHIVKIAEETRQKDIWDMASDDRKVSMAQTQKFVNGPRGRGKQGSEYIVVDEITDMAAMVAVYVILAILELLERMK